MVNGLEDLDVQSFCEVRVERKLEYGEYFSESLYTDAKSAVIHSSPVRRSEGIVSLLKQFVQVANHYFGDAMEFLVVYFSGVGDDVLRERDRCQSANCGMLFR